MKDEASGIAVSHPRDWSVQTFGLYCRRVGPGLLISNLRRYRFRNVEIPRGCTNAWQLARLPERFVLVDVSLFHPPPGAREETQGPLELTRVERPSGRSFASGRIVRHGVEYSVRVWTGRGVSDEDEEAVARVIRSVAVDPPR